MSSDWHFLISLNEQLRPLKDPVEIQDVAVRLLGQHLDASRVHYAEIDGDEFVIRRFYAKGVEPFSGRGPITKFGSAVLDAVRRGETVAVCDVQTDSRFTDEDRVRIRAAGTAAFVGTPLIKGGRWLGSLGVHSQTPRNWTPDQIALVEITADRMWSAGERALAEEALGRSESRQAFLHRLYETVRPLTDSAGVLDQTCRLLGTYLRADRVVYCEIGPDGRSVVHDRACDGQPTFLCSRWCSFLGRRREHILDLKGWTLSASDTSADDHSAEERETLEAAGIRAYIAPLLIRNGQLAGAFGIHSHSPRAWTADEISLVQEAADRIWATLEHRKAEAELRANEERLAFLLHLNDAIRPLRDDSAIQDIAARQVGEYLGATRVGFAEPDGREFVVRHEYTRGVTLLGQPVRITMGSALREVLERGETIVVGDVQADDRLSPEDRATFQSRQIGSFVGLGLFKDGRMVATFGANHQTPRAWSPREIEFVREVAGRTWDAVERTRADAALREQKTRLSLAIQASGGGCWTWNARTNETYWDETFRAQFGFTEEEPAVPEKWLDCVHAKDRDWLDRAIKEILERRGTWDHTYRVRLPDGSERWMQSLGRADRDATGQVTRLTGLELDITERRRTEDALRARRDEQYDRTLRTLLENATQGIVSADTSGTVLFANRAVERMFGWAAHEVIGRPIERLIPSIFRDGPPLSGGLDLVGTRKDGSDFPTEVTVTHVPTPVGGRVFAFVTDITDRQRAATALRERTAELERRTTQLSQMAWDLTLAEHHAREEIARTLHDGLQQLLVIVALNLELQLKQDNEQGATPSALLTQAKQHLGEAIAVARSLNVELFPPVLQHSGLPDALTWLADWTRDKYKMTVEICADSQADTGRKDVRTLLFESVRELLFNAVKYAQTDRVTVTLALDAGDQISVTVADEGVGFEPGKLDDRSKSGHVGWGLFRIRERLTLLGGQLDINSVPGRGTRIRLVAPRNAARSEVSGVVATSLHTPNAEPTEADALARRDALRILIVDDHAPVRQALREMIQQQPQLSVVGEASNGFEAIDQAHALEPDVILMDVQMPHMNGVEATRRLGVERPGITILGVSMLANKETAEAIQRAGASEFFVKGTDTQRLIDYLLTRHASRRHSDRALA